VQLSRERLREIAAKMLQSGEGIIYERTQQVQMPRAATPEEIAGWFDSADQAKPPPKHEKNMLRDFLAAKDRRRWARLEREFQWAQGAVQKIGYNPEDVRWIL
jgi:hypothetical protein